MCYYHTMNKSEAYIKHIETLINPLYDTLNAAHTRLLEKVTVPGITDGKYSAAKTAAFKACLAEEIPSTDMVGSYAFQRETAERQLSIVFVSSEGLGVVMRKRQGLTRVTAFEPEPIAIQPTLFDIDSDPVHTDGENKSLFEGRLAALSWDWPTPNENGRLVWPTSLLVSAKGHPLDHGLWEHIIELPGFPVDGTENLVFDPGDTESNPATKTGMA